MRKNKFIYKKNNWRNKNMENTIKQDCFAFKSDVDLQSSSAKFTGCKYWRKCCVSSENARFKRLRKNMKMG